MKLLDPFLLALLTTLTSAQLLDQSNGNLPACGQQCNALTSAQTSCGSSWQCFCQTVWQASGQNPAAICASTCTSPNDLAAVAQWYTANCGSDNGASEHGGSQSGSGNAEQSGSAAPSASSGTTDTGVESTSSSGSSCGGPWWDCHWQWIVMVIVLAIGLSILGFGARWYKKRYDRKHDQTAFNAGITSSTAAVTNDKEGSGSNSSGDVAQIGPVDSPARTREAYMPYGYGYARSQSRTATRDESPVTRGGTPFEELEKGAAGDVDEHTGNQGVRGKMSRVLVRERSLGSK